MPTRLSDIIDTTVYQDLPAENSSENTVFFESGVATRTPKLDEFARAPGSVAEMPFWRDLDASEEPNYSSDDPDKHATPGKVKQSEQKAYKAHLNNGWSEMDLANELVMGPNALQHVRNRVDRYWVRQWQRRLIATVLGIAAENRANGEGDMIHDVAVEDLASVSAATRFSRSNFIEAAYTMGDHVEGVVAMAVHSMIAKQIADQGEAEDVVDAEGKLLYRTYMGRRIFVDDGLPAIAAGATGAKFLSVLFGAGAIGYGEGTPLVPVEITRDASAGDGGGMEELWTRKTWLIHPEGYDNKALKSKSSQTLSDLADPDNWERLLDRKNIPLAFMWTN